MGGADAPPFCPSFIVRSRPLPVSAPPPQPTGTPWVTARSQGSHWGSHRGSRPRSRGSHRRSHRGHGPRRPWGSRGDASAALPPPPALPAGPEAAAPGGAGGEPGRGDGSGSGSVRVRPPKRSHEPQELPGLHQVLPLPSQPLLLLPGHPPPRLQLLGAVRPAELRRRAGVAAAKPEALLLRLLGSRHGHHAPGLPGLPGGPQGGQGHAGAVFRAAAAAPRCPDHRGHHRLHAARRSGCQGGRLRRGADPQLPSPGTTWGPPRELGRCPAAARLLWLEGTPGLGAARWGRGRGQSHRLLLPQGTQQHPREPGGAAPWPLPHGRPPGHFPHGLQGDSPELAGRKPGHHRGGLRRHRPGGALPADAVDVPAPEPGLSLREAAAGALRGPGWCGGEARRALSFNKSCWEAAEPGRDRERAEQQGHAPSL